MRRTLSVLTVVGVLLAGGSAWGAYDIDDFDARIAGDLNGQGQWTDSGVVTVTNTPTYAASALSAAMGAGSRATNAVDVTPTAAWTEFRMQPALGDENAARTNGASLSLYFHSDGYLRVWNSTAWQICSNTIWGGAAPKASNGVWAAVAIYQNFSTDTNVVFFNDYIVAQDIPFPDDPAAGKYNYFVAGNEDNNATLETVWIQSTNDTSRHARDDGDSSAGVDADEVATYGYAGRTFNVGGGTGYPQFATIQAAVDAARDIDTLYIAAGTYTQDVMIANNVTFEGPGFTLEGEIGVASGYTVTLLTGTDLTVDGTLSVTGTLAVANSTTVSGAVVNISGSITLSTLSSSLLQASDLNITGSGTLVSSGGSLNEFGVPVCMVGTFTIDSDWDTAAASTLNFSENWELYCVTQRVDGLGFYGWGASSPSVVVSNNEGVSSSQACILPSGNEVFNRVSSAATKIWTDYYIRPHLGGAPDLAPTGTSAYVSYADTNGNLVVATGGSWYECDTNWSGGATPALAAGTMRRVTFFTDFTAKEFAVFLEGDLLREQQPFPGQSVTTYSSFLSENRSSATNVAYLDKIAITTTVPGGSDDLDTDGMSDMLEIHNYGTIGGDPQGTLFRFM